MTVLLALGAIADGQARGIAVEQDGRKQELILVRRGERVFAYVNSCPHIGTPLDTFPDRFLDRTGARLLCSTHGAQFRVEDGYCVGGPCAGRRLARVAVDVVAGDVVLAGPLPAPPLPMG